MPNPVVSGIFDYYSCTDWRLRRSLGVRILVQAVDRGRFHESQSPGLQRAFLRLFDSVPALTSSHEAFWSSALFSTI